MSGEHDTEGIRHRRTRSVTAAEDIQKTELKVRRSQPDNP